MYLPARFRSKRVNRDTAAAVVNNVLVSVDRLARRHRLSAPSISSGYGCGSCAPDEVSNGDTADRCVDGHYLLHAIRHLLTHRSKSSLGGGAAVSESVVSR